MTMARSCSRKPWSRFTAKISKRFRRGSAAARHFLHRKAGWCATLGIPVKAVTFAFVGLYDTVSSYGGNFDDDVDELGLRLGDAALQKVVHLTARNEYRKNFSLTTIASAIAAGVGYELELPGVHSDVGGGYPERARETVEDVSLVYKTALIAAGWYTEAQFARHVRQVFGREVGDPWYVGKRFIRYHYQLIPLEIMQKLATKYGMQFSRAQGAKKANLTLPPDDAQLAAARQTLVQFALQNDRAHSVQALFATNTQQRWVRNRYLHRSVSDSTGMGPRLTKDGKPNRQRIAG